MLAFLAKVLKWTRTSCFAMNTSVSSLDERGGDGRYIKLMGPLLQPDVDEKQTSLNRIELTDEFLQGVGRAVAEESVAAPGL